ncbi:MAG TPA: ABC transporter substrate-binding protein [Bradyrhizobium sp.]|uniref:ABC transporter substrate-binding protein n=1 Tax=Bradyrhizobium sp. TaxID=376 RepID=UPI002B4A8448|nr:ABC transporter substrate-binding protein [Bradyrhizobium sp.]HKO73299.1 ABC transporter substrate-binding protein [Bradyrhizobium sp.]
MPAVVSAAGPDVVRFGVLHPNLTTVIHEIAKRTGAYQRHNLNVVETRFKSGQTVEGVEQLWRGNLDFYMGGAPEIPRLNSRLIESGSPAPLAVVSGANPGHTSLVLSNKLHPKTIDEILHSPLRIAVSSLSSVHLAFFRGYLLAEKHLLTKDIAWQFLAVRGGDMVPALLTGQIDGFLHSEPTTTLAIVNNAGHLFMHAADGDMGPNPPPATLMGSRRDFIKDKNEIAKRFMRAIFDANEAYEKDPAAMAPVIAEWSGQDEKIVRLAEKRMNPVTSLTHAQAEKWWDFIGKAMIERGELSPKLRPFEDIFDLSLQPLGHT